MVDLNNEHIATESIRSVTTLKGECSNCGETVVIESETIDIPIGI